MSGRRLGLLGGSFDPIHNGHLALAIEMKERANLDEVLLAPAHCSPGKVERPPVASNEARAEMVRLAIEGVLGLTCTTLEYDRPSPSYTIDTVVAIDLPLHLILGPGSLDHLFSWKEIDRLLALAPPLLATWDNLERVSPPKKYEHFFENALYPIPRMEISSSAIRARLKAGLPCPHLTPAKVLDYIYSNRLY